MPLLRFFKSPAVLVLTISVLLFVIVFIRSIEVRGTSDIPSPFVPGFSSESPASGEGGEFLREPNPVEDPGTRPETEAIPDRDVAPD